MSKIYIKRNSNYFGMSIKFQIFIDDVEYPEMIINNQIVEIDIKPGPHEIAIKQILYPKAKTEFTIDADEEVYFETGVSKMVHIFLGILLASFFVTLLGNSGLILAFLLILSVTIGSLIYTYVLKKLHYIKAVRRAKVGTVG